MDLPDVALINYFLHSPDRWREQEGMANHQDQAVFLGEGDEFFTLSHGAGQRFFDENMFACQQSGLGHFVVKTNRGCHYDGVQFRVLKQIIKLIRCRNIAMQLAHVFQALLARITVDFKMTTRRLP